MKKSIEDVTYFNAIDEMIKIFCKRPYPHKIDIVTTNYDRTLEYAISRLGYDCTDGFTGRQLSKLNESNFQIKKQINLMKVHGSLSWFQFKSDEPFFLSNIDKQLMDQLKPLMILPSNRKYQDAFEEPYRTIITKSDKVINEAKNFLVIGFGFNDEHITPKLENKIKNGTPIVIITKKATDSCLKKLQNVTKYCLFEEDEYETTKIKSSEQELEYYKTRNLEGTYWKLEQFMEIL